MTKKYYAETAGTTDCKVHIFRKPPALYMQPTLLASCNYREHADYIVNALIVFDQLKPKQPVKQTTKTKQNETSKG